jgi:single-stranded DNA-binding protein
MYMNLVMLAGFLGKDTVARWVDNGNFTIFELVIDLPSKDKESNEYVLRSESDDLIAFGSCGEDAPVFKKGDYIIVTGELRQSEHENDRKQQCYTIWLRKLRRAPGARISALEEPDVEEIREKTETE